MKWNYNEKKTSSSHWVWLTWVLLFTKSWNKKLFHSLFTIEKKDGLSLNPRYTFRGGNLLSTKGATMVWEPFDNVFIDSGRCKREASQFSFSPPRNTQQKILKTIQKINIFDASLLSFHIHIKFEWILIRKYWWNIFLRVFRVFDVQSR